MSDLAYALVLRRLIAAWSDEAQEEAVKLADDHRHLLPRRITNAQLYGLANVVRSARNFADVGRFLRRQAEKATRAGSLDVHDYWMALDETRTKLRGEARRLREQAGAPPPARGEAELDELHRELAATFVQHLIAHSLYWTPARGDETEGREP